MADKKKRAGAGCGFVVAGALLGVSVDGGCQFREAVQRRERGLPPAPMDMWGPGRIIADGVAGAVALGSLGAAAAARLRNRPETSVGDADPEERGRLQRSSQGPRR